MLNFLQNFYTAEERKRLNELNDVVSLSPTKDDSSLYDKEYVDLMKLYKKLLDSNLTDEYRIEVGPNCTFLIEKLFERYVNDDTFVLVTEQEHPAVKNYLKTKNVYVLLVDDINKKDVIKRIIRKYRSSKCKSFFLMMAGVIPGSAEVLNQQFFVNLKNSLVTNSIPHTLILDDCQGIYMTKRDYSIFDGILGTAHVLIKTNFEMGILFTKLKHKIGYFNKAALNVFADKLMIVCNHRQNALKFNKLVSEFLKDEIDNKDFEMKSTQAQHMAVIKANKIKFNQKYADELEAVNITFSELNTPVGMIRLRYQEAIMKDPNEYIKKLNRLKHILRSLKRGKELRESVIFDNSENINYNFEVNGNIKVSKINKKPLKTKFYTKDNDIENQHEDIIENQTKFNFHYIFNRSRG